MGLNPAEDAGMRGCDQVELKERAPSLAAPLRPILTRRTDDSILWQGRIVMPTGHPGSTPTCAAEGCNALGTTAGLCVPHYEQRRWANPDKGLCSIDTCESPARKKGWCSLHYQRWLRNGDPLLSLSNQGLSAEERFWSKVNKISETGCWEWQSNKSPLGYGVSFWDNGRHFAHRWAYEHLVGPIPEGLTIDHLCRNPSCCNPAHLEPVTMRENVLRGIGPAAVNARKTHCPQGHPYDDVNTYRLRNGGRACKACRRTQKARARQAKQK